jgi:hypothetical protein
VGLFELANYLDVKHQAPKGELLLETEATEAEWDGRDITTVDVWSTVNHLKDRHGHK